MSTLYKNKNSTDICKLKEDETHGPKWLLKKGMVQPAWLLSKKEAEAVQLG